MKKLSLILLFCTWSLCTGCGLFAGKRDFSATVDPSTRVLTIKGSSNLVDGPIEVHFAQNADGSFSGSFSADPTQGPAVAAKALDLQGLIGSLQFLKELAVVAAPIVTQSQGIPLPPAPAPAPTPVPVVVVPASQPASAPAKTGN